MLSADCSVGVIRKECSSEHDSGCSTYVSVADHYDTVSARSFSLTVASQWLFTLMSITYALLTHVNKFNRNLSMWSISYYCIYLNIHILYRNIELVMQFFLSNTIIYLNVLIGLHVFWRFKISECFEKWLQYEKCKR